MHVQYIIGLYRIVILRPDPDYPVFKKAGSGYPASKEIFLSIKKIKIGI